MSNNSRWKWLAFSTSNQSFCFFSLFFLNLGALSLIQCCLKPDANTRATTKDILDHDWLAHGPVLAIRPHSGSTTIVPLPNQFISNTLSPSNSLTQLELHTSSFFDNTRSRDIKDQSTRHRLSAIPISTRYLSSKNPPSLYRRPVSLSLDEPSSNVPNEPSLHISSLLTRPTHSSHSKTTYANHDRYQSTSIPRYTLAPSSESTRNRSNESNPPSLAPSVFTTSSIKFAPVPLRRVSPVRDVDSLAMRLANPSSTHTDDQPSRRSFFTSLDLPSTTEIAKSNLLDDNNNFISLRIYD